ncbi:MAG: hypothetical protein RSG52_11230 [Terrisporobacter sp.]|uniref:hypothetical protein n=1 Tax=Terrisporobacter sp. TaxID=1965305 RepID=UPI002FCBE7DF
MKNFYIKYKNPIGIMMDVMLIVLGLSTKNYIFAILGVILLFLTLYVAKIERREAEEKAKQTAEKKRINKAKKKKKKKR